MLVTDYIRRARRAAPKIEAKAKQFISLGYQKLLTFQHESGGFGWYAGYAPDIRLTAYVLLQLSDMSKVHDVDKRVIERAQKWLDEQQRSNGSWNDSPVLTAYVTWSLIETGMAENDKIKNAKKYIEKNSDTDDPYYLALAANAIKDQKLIDRLAELKSEVDGLFFFTTKAGTLYGSSGETGNVETTGLAILALLKSDKHKVLVQGAVNFIIKSKQASGAWGSTQPTIMALKSLIANMADKEEKTPVSVTLKLGEDTRTILIKPEDSDVMRLFEFKSVNGENDLIIEADRKTNLIYQAAAIYYTPWIFGETTDKSTLKLDLKYAKTNLRKGETVKVNAKLKYTGKASTFMVMAEIGLPAGFDLDTKNLTTVKKIDKFSSAGKELVIYLNQMQPGEEIDFSFDLKAKYPLHVKSSGSKAYEYYAPTNKTTANPVELMAIE